MSDHEPIEAVLFDFHGTLVDGGEFSFEVAMGTLLGSLRGSGVEVDEDRFVPAYRDEVRRYFDEHANQGREQHNTVWLARALTRVGSPAQPGDAPVRRAVDAYFDRYASEMRPLPGAGDVLRELSERYRLGLLSNFTDPRPVLTVLEREGFSPYLEAVVISADVGRRKPVPEIFELALQRLGTRPERTLFVGDDPQDDIDGARAVGMRTAWVRPGEDVALLRWIGGEPVPDRAAADYTLDGLPELLPLLAA